MNTSKFDKAKTFYELHRAGSMLLLPNAWDVLSAKIFEQEGAKSIGTTSAGIAAVYGYTDGEKVPPELFFNMVERIIRSVNCPVTVDIECGMGQRITTICHNVQRLVAIGAVGINIEDSKNGVLIPAKIQAEKIEAIRKSVDKSRSKLFVNARIDTYWLNASCNEQDRYTETISRAEMYQNAGADGIFVPGLTDVVIIEKLAKEIPLPLNILLSPATADIEWLNNIGVARLSSGSNFIRNVNTHMQRIANCFLKRRNAGFLNDHISYSEFNLKMQARIMI